MMYLDVVEESKGASKFQEVGDCCLTTQILQEPAIKKWKIYNQFITLESKQNLVENYANVSCE